MNPVNPSLAHGRLPRVFSNACNVCSCMCVSDCACVFKYILCENVVCVTVWLHYSNSPLSFCSLILISAHIQRVSSVSICLFSSYTTRQGDKEHVIYSSDVLACEGLHVVHIVHTGSIYRELPSCLAISESYNYN